MGVATYLVDPWDMRPQPREEYVEAIGRDGEMDVVALADYSALLSVLRQCVNAMDIIPDVLLTKLDIVYDELNDALRAARPYLESKEEKK